MIQKLTVAWVLSLFVWNAALAGVPRLLLCLHDDFLVHLESDASAESHCEDSHGHVPSEDSDVCSVSDGCTDLELAGGELIPSRMSQRDVLDVPIFSSVVLCDLFVAFSLNSEDLRLRPPSRAPPSVHWLTDFYIKKTVLRV